MNSTECLAGGSPVTILVCDGQVTDGLELFMRRAEAPSRMSLRSVGMGNAGSSSVNAGKPSRLTTTTMRSFAAAWAGRPGHTAIASSNERKRFRSMLPFCHNDLTD